MASRANPSVAKDFEEAWSHLKGQHVIPIPTSARIVAAAKRIHRATYSLILWNFRLKKIPEHGKAFIEEIASDALQFLPQALLGYGKTTKLLNRGIIENTLRHVYFLDHPIEFAKMNRDQKWYPMMDELWEYPMYRDDFLAAERRFDAINKLKALYSELSCAIHGRRVQDLEMRAALRAIVCEDAPLELHAKLIERTAESTNFVLGVLHADQLHGFMQEDRRIIVRSMRPIARAEWKRH